MFRLVPDAASEKSLDDLAFFFNSVGIRIGGEKGEIHEAVIAGFQDNFRGEHSAAGPWAQLAPMAIRERQMAGYPGAHPILHRSGNFYNSLVNPDDSEHYSQAYTSSNLFSLEVGSLSDLLSIHESGTGRIPARSVTELTTGSEDHIGDAIDGLIARLLNGAGL